MHTTIKAVVINPFTRTITETRLARDQHGSVYGALRDTIFPDRDLGYLEHLSVGMSHGLYIDEEGVLRDWDEQAFFKLGAELVIAGIGVIVLDTSDGESADCFLPVDLVATQVTWLDTRAVRVPAPVMTSMDQDGTVHTTLLAGCEEWTYDNQPG